MDREILFTRLHTLGLSTYFDVLTAASFTSWASLWTLDESFMYVLVVVPEARDCH